MWQRLDVFSCVGLGWRWGTQTVAIQLRERGNIMRWSLTEEHREQSISKYVEAEERNAAGYENEWESDGFSLGCKKRWLLCPAQEEQCEPPQEDQPHLPPRWLRWVLQWWHYVLRQLQYHFATCPITSHPCSQAEKGLWQYSHVTGRQSERLFNPGPSSPGKTGHHFCSAKTSVPSRVGKVWLETRIEETSALASVFKCLWWTIGDYCCLKSNWKAAELLTPAVPGLAVLVVPTEAEWGPETFTLSCFPKRAKILQEASGKDLHASTGAIEYESKRRCWLFIWRTHGKTSCTLATLAEENQVIDFRALFRV